MLRFCSEVNPKVDHFQGIIAAFTDQFIDFNEPNLSVPGTSGQIIDRHDSWVSLQV